MTLLLKNGIHLAACHTLYFPVSLSCSGLTSWVLPAKKKCHPRVHLLLVLQLGEH